MKEDQRSRILIVDDEENVLNSLKRILKHENYDTFLAHDAMEALNLLEHEKIDLVLADYLMPEMTGNELLDRIRVLYPDTFRLVLSGKADLNNAIEAINKGQIYRFITKPWHDEELKLIVRQALELKHAKDLARENERTYRVILDNVNVGILYLTRDGNIQVINITGAGFLGGTPNDFIGKSICDIIPAMAETTAERIRQVTKLKKRVKFEDLIEFPTGNRTMLTEFLPLMDSNDEIIAIQLVSQDITERKLATEALRRSETLYRTLFDFSRDAVMLLDEKGFFDCNEATLRIFACKNKEEFCSKHPADLSPATQPCGTDSMTLADERIMTAMEKGGNHFEWTHKRTNGREFPADVLLSAMELNGRKVLQAVVRDITERKNFEDAIINAKQEWERTFDTIPDLITILDKRHRIVRLNMAMANNLGVAPADAIGLTCYEHVHGTDEPPPFCPHTKLMEDRKSHVEEVCEEKLGGDFVVSVSPLYDEKGHLKGSVHVAHDITERKKMERELLKSEAVLKKAQRLAKVGSCEWDLVNNSFQSSEEMRRIYGISDNERVANIEDLTLEYVHPDDRERVTKNIAKTMKMGAGKPITFRIVRPDGDVRWIVSSVVEQNTSNNNKKLNSITATVQDITEHVQAQEEKRKLENQVLQSEKMASVGQLAAGVAHEINNPTGFVSSNLTTLSDYQNDIKGLTQEYRKLISDLKDINPQTLLPGSITEHVAKIESMEEEVDIDYIMDDFNDLIDESKEGTDRIKKIVIDLKDFAHPGEDEIQTLDINKGIESTLNVVWNEVKYKAEVTKDYGKIPLVEGYPQQLNQVFMNILVNAAQAIEDRGEIKIGTRTDDGFVEVNISDTGAGIHEENLSKIFDPFFTTKEVGKGTGLGMNVAYNIIKKHNGIIDVDSTVGKGTTFRIRIPVN